MTVQLNFNLFQDYNYGKWKIADEQPSSQIAKCHVLRPDPHKVYIVSYCMWHVQCSKWKPCDPKKPNIEFCSRRI